MSRLIRIFSHQVIANDQISAGGGGEGVHTVIRPLDLLGDKSRLHLPAHLAVDQPSRSEWRWWFLT